MVVHKGRCFQEFYLDLEGHHWPVRVVYQVFTDAAVKEMSESFPAVGAYPN